MKYWLQTLMGRLRAVALLEGTSFLLILFVTMPLKYWYGYPALNRPVGLIHGLLFVVYVMLVIQARIEYNWSARKTALALLASVIPFGTFWADVRLFRTDNA